MFRQHARAPSHVVFVLLLTTECCPAAEEPLAPQTDRALAKAMHALIAAQSADGAWRSRHYGVFKEGPALTPAVLKAVVFGPDVSGSAQARKRGADYLAARIRPDGSIDGGPFGLPYPVYDAAAAVMAVARLGRPEDRRAIDGWQRALRSRQLIEGLGWAPGDLAYGAWGDSFEPSRKGPPDATIHADVSSTLFAIGALRIAGADADDPAIRAARGFLERCQNFATTSGTADPAFDDGGFFFSPTDPVRNKAGTAGADRHGRIRMHSYGSATADGLRALLRSGVPTDHPRVTAARGWLVRYFSTTSNPGDFQPIHEPERDATYYYYCWSFAHTFRALGVERIDHGGAKVAWADELARELLHRQHPDGTWVNRFTASKEDDPLVATSLAAGALGICRTFLH